MTLAVCPICAYDDIPIEDFRFSICGHGLCKKCAEEVRDLCFSCRAPIDPKHGLFPIFMPALDSVNFSSKSIFQHATSALNATHQNPAERSQAIAMLLDHIDKAKEEDTRQGSKEVTALRATTEAQEREIAELKQNVSKYKESSNTYKLEKRRLERAERSATQLYEDLSKRHQETLEDSREVANRAEAEIQKLKKDLLLVNKKLKILGKQRERPKKRPRLGDDSSDGFDVV